MVTDILDESSSQARSRTEDKFDQGTADFIWLYLACGHLKADVEQTAGTLF
jgi:hypothetical protein